MALPSLPYGRQLIEDDDVAAVVAQLRSDWLTQGPTVARFEEALCAATGSRYAVAVSSGTAALHLACLAAGVRQGDRGLTSTNTFVASANAIRYAGGAPRLVDIEPETGHLRLDQLHALATQGRAPKVIIPVDFGGAVSNLPAVRSIADQVGALVIEDAAHSLGATYEHGGETWRAGCGQHAHMAILSFHPVKHITTGEGGAILTQDETLYRELLDLRTHGITKDPKLLEAQDGPWYYEQRTLGYHYRIPDLLCALGVSQLAKADRFVARRRALAARYDTLLAPHADRVSPLKVRLGTRSSYHLYVIRLVARSEETLEQLAARRKALFLSLRDKGIFAQVHYIPVHRQPDFKHHGLSEGGFPGADAYYASCLSVPLFPAMNDSDVDRVVEAILSSLLEK